MPFLEETRRFTLHSRHFIYRYFIARIYFEPSN